jgi:hypothetical protein
VSLQPTVAFATGEQSAAVQQLDEAMQPWPQGL